MNNYFDQTPSASPGAPGYHPGLEQLMVAALVNPQFAALLIADPAAALATNHGIALSEAERALASAIRDAVDIHDYATRLRAHIRQQTDEPGAGADRA